MTVHAAPTEVLIDLTDTGRPHIPAREAPHEERTGGARRQRVARLALIAGGLSFAAWLLFPQMHELPAALGALRGASPLWLGIGVMCTLSAYAAAALALQATSGPRLPLARNFQVQVASTAAAAVTPAGAGGIAVHTRFLESRGVPRTQALGAVGLGRLTAATVHLTTLLVLAPGLARRTGVIALPPLLPIGVALGILGSLLFARRHSARLRALSDRLHEPLAGAARRVRTDPRRIAGLLGGSLMVSVFRALTFAAALQALGVGKPLVAVAALFLAAEALGALGTTPGGLGVLDGVLLTGILALGAAPAAGLGAILVFRLLTLWAPVLPGLLTLRLLRRAAVL